MTSKTFYKADTISYEVYEVEVVNESATMVAVVENQRQRKYAKKTHYHRFFEKKEDAYNYLLQHCAEKISVYKSNLLIHEEIICKLGMEIAGMAANKKV